MKREMKTYLESLARAKTRYEEGNAKLREIYGITDVDIRKYEMEQEQKMTDFDFAGEAYALVRGYLDAKKEYDAGWETIRRDYQGELRKKKETEHQAKAPDKDLVTTKLNEYAQIYLSHLDELQSKSLDSGNITKDYDWLSKPVILSVDELQRLHARNANDPIFCRALQAYYLEHENNYDVLLDLRDGLSVQREIIESSTKELIRDVVSGEHDSTAMVGIQGYCEAIGARLSGEGLYAPPKVIEPEEGEEEPESEPPAPDDSND